MGLKLHFPGGELTLGGFAAKFQFAGEGVILNKNSNLHGLPSASSQRSNLSMEPSHEKSQPGVVEQPELTGESLDISDLMRNRNALTRFPGVYRFDDIKTQGSVYCDWNFVIEAAGFLVQGELKTTLDQECVRCLEPCIEPLTLHIEERFVLDSFVDRSEKEKELLSEDFYEVVKEDGELDLKDLAHQWLMLQSENNPLCGRAECHFN